MVAQPVVVPNGPYAGLYMPLDGSIAYVKETRPYASPFINLIYDMKKDDVADDDLKAAIIGPSGWLRAPTWKRGKTLVVGFHADAYDDVLG